MTRELQPDRWNEVRERLQRITAPQPDHPGPELARSILAARAAALARPNTGTTAAESLELIVFRRGSERYAIPSAESVAVVRAGSLTPIPGSAPEVRGLCTRGGHLMLVVEVAAGAEDADPCWALALTEGHMSLAIAADEIERVTQVPLEEIRPFPESSAPKQSWLRGLTADALQVIDAAALIRTYS